jgi:hypothetical protein
MTVRAGTSVERAGTSVEVATGSPVATLVGSNVDGAATGGLVVGVDAQPDTIRTMQAESHSQRPRPP